ncbi:Heat shock protein beta-1 [Trachymyrmex cornetzi]|uniref:Heat shock protein beta-1 n=2 Tax=Formicidae TaxID=36668 RepID=A0A195EDE3_9HYME|nr:Heat shock protein beta-1 [Trachymyrmex cornetzi]
MADSGIKRNIPIKLGDFSVIDTEFSNIRERFDAEMRKMEDEMSRFRSELMNRESNNFFKSTTSARNKVDTSYKCIFLRYTTLLRQCDLDIVSRCTIANGPHWNQALNRDAGKVRSLQGSIYAVIFTTSSRQPHRHSPRCRAKRAWSVQGFTMIPNEDFYPPAHKTIIKLRRHHTSTSEHHTSTTSKTDGWDKVDPAAPSKRSAFDTFKSTTTQQSTQNSSSLSPQHDHAWLDGLNSPLIQDEGDNKMLKLRFDVSQYTPEEIVVKTVDNKLLVHAKHEEKTESKSVYREYNREFLLPKGTNPESIKSSLSKDGVLTVEAPLPAIGSGEKLIPIAHQ